MFDVWRQTGEAAEAGGEDDPALNPGTDISKLVESEAALKKKKSACLEGNIGIQSTSIQSLPVNDDKQLNVHRDHPSGDQTNLPEGVSQLVGAVPSSAEANAKLELKDSKRGSGKLDDMVSFSSQICASWRAIESEQREEKRLIYDPLAKILAGDEAMKRARASRSPGKSRARFAIRTRYFDEFLEDNLRKDLTIKQVVILGAGMDTRAYRIQSLLKDVTVFEVDQSCVLKLKEKLLTQVEDSFPLLCKKVYRIGADLQEFGWEAGLITNGFNWNEKSIWLIESLMYYFDEDDVLKIFKTIRRLTHKGSQLCFSCVAKGQEHGDDKSVARMYPSACLSSYFRWRCDDPASYLKKLSFDVYSIVRLGDPGANYGAWDASVASGVMYVKFEPVIG